MKRLHAWFNREVPRSLRSLNLFVPDNPRYQQQVSTTTKPPFPFLPFSRPPRPQRPLSSLQPFPRV